MAINECIYCGGTVNINGYCSSCGLGQDFLRKAGNTSLHYYNVGLDRARARDLTGAIDALRMSLRYNKTNVNARNLLGLICYSIGDVTSALQHWVISVNYVPEGNVAVRYLKELRDDPGVMEMANDTARAFNQGLNHAKNHEIDLAKMQLKKCISQNPRYLKAYLLMALISIYEKRKGAARKYLQRVVAIDKNNPDALYFLHELGDSDEAIVRMTEKAQDEESAEDLFDYYGMETQEKGRPARKIKLGQKTGRRTTGKIREQNLARFSNIYMVTGIIIGAIVFYALIMPGVKNSLNQKHKKELNELNKVISVKNSEIDGLDSSVERLTNNNKTLASESDAKQADIDSLTSEVESLKQVIAQNGVKLPEADGSSDVENAEGQTLEQQEGDDGKKTGASEQDVQGVVTGE